jgi:hypothetical protein
MWEFLVIPNESKITTVFNFKQITPNNQWSAELDETFVDIKTTIESRDTTLEFERNFKIGP